LLVLGHREALNQLSAIFFAFGVIASGLSLSDVYFMYICL